VFPRYQPRPAPVGEAADKHLRRLFAEGDKECDFAVDEARRMLRPSSHVISFIVSTLNHFIDRDL